MATVVGLASRRHPVRRLGPEDPLCVTPGHVKRRSARAACDDPAHGRSAQQDDRPRRRSSHGRGVRACRTSRSPRRARPVASVVSASIIWRVFAENKLALVSIGVIVFMLLFCFVGPHLYVTHQANLVVTSVGQVLAHPGRPAPLRDRPERLRHRGPPHGRAERPPSRSRCSAAGIATVFGVFFGAVSGYAGGAVGRDHDEDRRHRSLGPHPVPA